MASSFVFAPINHQLCVLLWLRMGVHRFSIDVGQGRGVPPPLYLCDICGSGAVGDEDHSIFVCPSFDSLGLSIVGLLRPIFASIHFRGRGLAQSFALSLTGLFLSESVGLQGSDAISSASNCSSTLWIGSNLMRTPTTGVFAVSPSDCYQGIGHALAGDILSICFMIVQ